MDHLTTCNLFTPSAHSTGYTAPLDYGTGQKSYGHGADVPVGRGAVGIHPLVTVPVEYDRPDESWAVGAGPLETG